MQTRRWTNPTQPQTLQIAVFLLYIQAVFTALSGAIMSPLGLAIVVGMAVSGYMIANEKKWGYWLAVVIASIPLIFTVFAIANSGLGGILSIGFVINMIMPVALFALLVHPQSRDYQRIWFS